MTHFPLQSPELATDPVVRRVFEEIERELGFGIVPNVFRAMAGHPGLLESTWSQFRAVVLQGRLPRVLKEMVGVVVSAAHDSPYARLVHLHSLGMQGVNADVLAELARGTTRGPGLSPANVAVLTFARAAALTPKALSAADFHALEEVGLSIDEALEVVAAVQVFSAINAFTDIAAVPVDAV